MSGRNWGCRWNSISRTRPRPSRRSINSRTRCAGARTVIPRPSPTHSARRQRPKGGDMKPDSTAWVRFHQALAQAHAARADELLKTPLAPEGGPVDRLLTVQAASARLGLSVTYLYRHSHELPFMQKHGRAWRVSAQALDAYVRGGGLRVAGPAYPPSGCAVRDAPAASATGAAAAARGSVRSAR